MGGLHRAACRERLVAGRHLRALDGDIARGDAHAQVLAIQLRTELVGELQAWPGLPFDRDEIGRFGAASCEPFVLPAPIITDPLVLSCPSDGIERLVLLQEPAERGCRRRVGTTRDHDKAGCAQPRGGLYGSRLGGVLRRCHYGTREGRIGGRLIGRAVACRRSDGSGCGDRCNRVSNRPVRR